MLLFQEEEAIDSWCQEHGEPRGEVLSLQQAWDLSRAWYGDRMDPDFRGHTAETVVEIFTRVGLTSEFWRP